MAGWPMDDELERTWKEKLVLSRHFHEGTEEYHGELQDNRWSYRDWNRASPENKSRELELRQPVRRVYLQRHVDLQQISQIIQILCRTQFSVWHLQKDSQIWFFSAIGNKGNGLGNESTHLDPSEGAKSLPFIETIEIITHQTNTPPRQCACSHLSQVYFILEGFQAPWRQDLSSPDIILFFL
jgi:hypothetical protein